MSSENTIKTLSQSLCKFVDFSNGEIQSRSNRDLHEHHRPVRVSRLAKTRANSSISVWWATTNPEAGQTVGGRVELLSALLSDKGLNIREAHVFSTTGGYSLDVFVVDGWPVEGSVVSPNVADFAMLWSGYKGIM
ncbi:unnamed protein product [Camellia sinensis]